MSTVLKPGLYIVATPIGHLEDITIRAIKTLQSVDIILCEDTRVSRSLLNHYEIQKPLIAFHAHNENDQAQSWVGKMLQGQRIALISDAGMPVISDPGHPLIQLCKDNNIYTTVIPGASAVLSALILSGLPAYNFMFCGFSEAKKWMTYKLIDASLVFFESPRRLIKTLSLMKEVFTDRHVCVVREITKVYEQSLKGSFEEILNYFNAHQPRGEIVIVLSPPQVKSYNNRDWQEALENALHHHSLKAAVQEVSQVFNIARKEVYQHALKIKR